MAVSMSILGRRLKETRKQRGYTQEYVAERINFSVIHLRAIERGAKSLNLVKLGEWCDVLDIPIEQIVSSSSIPENSDYNRQFGEIADGCEPETVELMLAVCGQIAEVERIGKKRA